MLVRAAPLERPAYPFIGGFSFNAYLVGPAQFAHHSSLKQISSRLKALIIAGLTLESPPQETTGFSPWEKHAFMNEIFERKV